MREPTIRTGFIIFNEEWKNELEKKGGHWKTAYEWIRKNGLQNLYEKVKETNNIYDEEQFLIDYIGAIKLYASGGNFYCYVPRMVNINKDFLRKYYKDLGYQITGSASYDVEPKLKVKKYKYPYNQTVIKKNNELIYNPLRFGD